MANETKQASSGFSWIISSLSEREQKSRGSQSWPFKVVKKGDREFNCITSISELEKSFNNTKYNNKTFDGTMKARGRYYRIVDSLQKKLGTQTQDIHYLYLSFDSIGYMFEDGRVGFYNYGNNIANELNSLVANVLFSSDIVKKAIIDFKGSGDGHALSSLVNLYIKSRTSMKILADPKKYILDIFKSDLSFRNVEYIVFSTTPEQAVDYSGYIRESVEKIKQNYLLQDNDNKLENELGKYVSLEDEKRLLEGLANKIRSGGKVEGLGKLKSVLFLNSALNVDSMKKYFVSLKNNEEKKEIEEKKAELEGKLLKSKEDIEDIFSMIHIMNSIVRISEQVGVEGEKSVVEYPIWIRGNYSFNAIKNRLNLLYQIENLKKTDIPIINILNEVFLKYYDKYDVEQELGYLKSYLPDNFKNDVHTFKSYGCDFETKEGIQKIIDSIKDIKIKFFYLFESVLGLEYAMFGVFMSRYTMMNAWVAKKKAKDLDEQYTPNHPFYLSQNVMEKANKSFYLIKYPDDFKDGKLSVEDINAAMGDSQYFVKYYLDLLTSDIKINFSEERKAFDENNEKLVRVVSYSKAPQNQQDIYRLEGLYRISECIVDILEECFRQIHSESSEVIDIKSFLESQRESTKNRLNG